MFVFSTYILTVSVYKTDITRIPHYARTDQPDTVPAPVARNQHAAYEEKSHCVAGWVARVLGPHLQKDESRTLRLL